MRARPGARTEAGRSGNVVIEATPCAGPERRTAAPALVTEGKRFTCSGGRTAARVPCTILQNGFGTSEQARPSRHYGSTAATDTGLRPVSTEQNWNGPEQRNRDRLGCDQRAAEQEQRLGQICRRWRISAAQLAQIIAGAPAGVPSEGPSGGGGETREHPAGGIARRELLDRGRSGVRGPHTAVRVSTQLPRSMTNRPSLDNLASEFQVANHLSSKRSAHRPSRSEHASRQSPESPQSGCDH